MSECPVCGEHLGLDEEWRLRPELEPGKLETEYDDDYDEVYMHKDCREDY